MDDAEHNLLAMMTTADGLTMVIDSEISPELFEDPYCRLIFSWVVDKYWPTNGAPPTGYVLEQEYPQVKVPRAAEVMETTDWLINWLKKRYVVNRGQDIIRRAAENLGDEQIRRNGEPADALAILEEEAKHALEQLGKADGEKSEPIPLTYVVPIPPFPVDALPDPHGQMVQAVAEATQTDPAMAGTQLLSVLSACHGGYARIEIRYGWQEPLCIYTATVASPGERKSAVQQAMVRPLLKVEKTLATRGSLDRLGLETRKQIAVRRAETLRNEAAKKTDKTEEALAAAREAEEIVVPVVPRLIADDVTPEAAGSLLAEQGGRLAIISAEGGIFDIIAGRYSNGQVNLDLWLKGHAGDMLKVDRKGRPAEYIEHPALTLGLMIQPDVLSALANNRQFRGRGLLARFLYAMPVSKVGNRTVSSAPISREVEKSYSTAVEALAMEMIKRKEDPALLTLSEEAQREFQRIEIAVEPTLAKDGQLGNLTDWGAKYMGALARIAGNLHLAEHGAKDGPAIPISTQTIKAAEQIAEYFKATAINAFAQMGADKTTTDALYLLERIKHIGTTKVSERDLHRAAQRFTTRQDMGPALTRLVDHGYLFRLPRPQSVSGRPGSQRYRVHESFHCPSPA